MNQYSLEGLDPRFLNDLYLFYQFFVANEKFKEKRKPAGHIKKICRYLMKLKLGRLDKHLAISVPPRHSKSSTITIAFPLWLTFQDPNLDILIISNTHALAEKFGIELREFIKRWGPYFNVYLSDEKKSSTWLMFCDKNGKLYNGSIRLTGAGGSITGFDADYLIIDDPYKGEEEDFTPTALQKKIDWYLTVIDQRIEPETKFLILHTRWHSQDLIGYFQEKLPEDFIFLTFPAIKEDNTPQWPEQYTIEELEKRKDKIGERLFSAIYQQMPLDETSDFFDIDKLDYITELNQDEEIIDRVRVWDIQSSESIKSDYTVGSLIVLTNQDRIGVTDIIRGQFADKTKEKILTTAKSDGYNVKILVETGVAAAGDLLFKEWEQQLEGYRVYRAKAIKSKPDRATPLKNGILDKRFFLLLNDSKIVAVVNRELRAFPEGQHDDIADTFAYGYNYFKLMLEAEKEATLGVVDMW
jgi:hypothetical protein